MGDVEVNFRRVCSLLGIPEEICRSYEIKNGLQDLYLWQAECLCNTGALLGNNLVYCAPTGGGYAKIDLLTHFNYLYRKTLVAELIILKTVISLRKKSILILPYVSLVMEKERDFRRILQIYNRSRGKRERIKVQVFHGESKQSVLGLKGDIVICTIEKANAIINHMISAGLISTIGCVVIDEMHVLGDIQRGYHLEILIRYHLPKNPGFH